MTSTEMEKRIAQLESTITELKNGAGSRKGWQPFGDFTATNRMSRTRLNTLIAQGKIEVDKCGRCFLYRWAA